MQDGLVAGIKNGKSRRALSDVASYNPFANADYVVAVNALRDVDFSLLTLSASQKDASIADIIDSLRLEGPVVETSDASELQPSHKQLMLLIYRLEDSPIAETPNAGGLQPSHEQHKSLSTTNGRKHCHSGRFNYPHQVQEKFPTLLSQIQFRQRKDLQPVAQHGQRHSSLLIAKELKLTQIMQR
nr:hypothetical protein [Tanacetum cinerariifolium]